MTDTKQVIVTWADHFLRSKGYNAFSYADISKKISVRNAAVHYHFPTKTDLVIAVIQKHIKSLEDFILVQRNRSPSECMEAFAQIYTKINAESKVCLVGTLTTDWDSLEDAAKDELKKFTNLLTKWLIKVLEKGLQSGEFKFTEPVRVKALLVVSNLMAAVQLSRAMDSRDFKSIRNSVIKSLYQ